MKKASGAGLQKEEGVHPTFAEKVECKRQFFTLGDMRIMPCYGLSIQLPRSQGGTQHFFFFLTFLRFLLLALNRWLVFQLASHWYSHAATVLFHVFLAALVQLSLTAVVQSFPCPSGAIVTHSP